MNSQSPPLANTFSTTLLMTASAAFTGGLGVGTFLFPEQILTHLGLAPKWPLLIIFHVMGALYLGYAGLNWMAREHLIGGIYSRPVAMGNFLHFFAAAIVLAKQTLTAPTSLVFAFVTAGYLVFAAGFGYVLFSSGSSCG